MDLAHKKTDEIIESLEKRLNKEYTKAYKEVKEKADDYFKRFNEKDKIKKSLLDKGDITEKEYSKWRKNKMLQGKRWNDLRDELAADMTRTNQIAATMVRGELAEVVALNANYSAYLLENNARTNYGFTIYSKDTIEELAKGQKDIIPWKPDVDVPKDLRWNKQQITSHITQGILQGESIPNLSKRLMKTVGNNKVSAIRTARTAITSSENAGRQTTYEKAESLGIKLQKQWVATLDKRTRDAHGHADGQTVDINDYFDVGGEQMEYPADPSASADNVYNCRCTMISVDEVVEIGDMPRMSYDEWVNSK